jgi:hypothetical protein
MLLVTSQFHFLVSKVEVSHILVFLFQSNKGGRAVTSVVVIEYCLIFMEQKFQIFCCECHFHFCCVFAMCYCQRFSLYPLLVSSSLVDSWWILSSTTPLFGL